MEDNFSVRQQQRASVLLMLVFGANVLIWIFTLYFKSLTAIIVRPGAIVLGAIWALYFLYLLRYSINWKVKRLSFAFISLILLFILFSNFVSSGHIREVTVGFFEYGLLGYLFSSLPFDMERVSRYACYFVLLLSIPIATVLRRDMERSLREIVIMGTSYGLLPLVLAAMAHPLFFRGKSNTLLRFSYLVNAIFFVVLMLRGTRGGVLCGLSLFGLCFMNTERMRRKSFKPGVMVLILIVVFIIMNIGLVLNMVNNVLMAVNINVNFIQKSLELIENGGDVSNGRLHIYDLALSGFLSSPVWGWGVGMFPEIHKGISYPHNIILQALFEGGLLLGIPIVLLLIVCTYKVLFGKIRNDNIRVAMIVLFSCSVPAVMLSGEFWNQRFLWAMFGLILKGRTSSNGS